MRFYGSKKHIHRSHLARLEMFSVHKSRYHKNRERTIAWVPLHRKSIFREGTKIYHLLRHHTVTLNNGLHELGMTVNVVD